MQRSPAPLMQVNCSGKAQGGGLIRQWTAPGSSACVCHRRLDQTPILTLYPETQIQLCIVHMARNSLRFLAWKDYKAVTRDLKQVYRAADLTQQ
ncbi:hypothetical protein VEE12_00630 [Escherichia coli]|nr:hypothetical protein VEE12_00630 [Escherichia coli]